MKEKRMLKSINFTYEQIRFIDENPQFKIQKFCRDKLNEYIQMRRALRELDGT